MRWRPVLASAKRIGLAVGTVAFVAVAGTEATWRIELSRVGGPVAPPAELLPDRAARVVWANIGGDAAGPAAMGGLMPWSSAWKRLTGAPQSVEIVIAAIARDTVVARGLGTHNDPPTLPLFALAVSIDRSWTIAELLAASGARMSFSHDVKGLTDAAPAFFHRPLADASFEELALLFANARGPSVDPWCFEGEATLRRNLMLERFRAHGLFDDTELARAKAAPLGLAPSAVPCK